MTPEEKMADLRVCDKCRKQTTHRIPVLPIDKRFPLFELWCFWCVFTHPFDTIPALETPDANSNDKIAVKPIPTKEYNDI